MVKWESKDSSLVEIQKSGNFERSNSVHNDKIGSNGLERMSIGYTMIKSGQMVLKGVNRVHNDKIQVKWSWKESIGYTMIKLGQMVLKGVNRVHNDKTGSNGLERRNLGRQYKNQVKWSWKESIGYTVIKSGQIALERSQLGTQW